MRNVTRVREAVRREYLLGMLIGSAGTALMVLLLEDSGLPRVSAALILWPVWLALIWQTRPLVFRRRPVLAPEQKP